MSGGYESHSGRFSHQFSNPMADMKSICDHHAVAAASANAAARSSLNPSAASDGRIALSIVLQAAATACRSSPHDLTAPGSSATLHFRFFGQTTSPCEHSFLSLFIRAANLRTISPGTTSPDGYLAPYFHPTASLAFLENDSSIRTSDQNEKSENTARSQECGASEGFAPQSFFRSFSVFVRLR